MSKPISKANGLLVDYLINSCLYYEFGVSEITDSRFDWLAHRLCEAWDKVDHPHKACIDIEFLRGSVSGYYIVYPSIVRSIAARKACAIPGSALYTRALTVGEENALMWWRHNVLGPDIERRLSHEKDKEVLSPAALP